MFSPLHTWVRISRRIAAYEEWNPELYAALLKRADLVVPTIEAMQNAGVDFQPDWKWCVDLCGSFEVTHPSYVPPVGFDLPEAETLYSAVDSAFVEIYGVGSMV